MYRIEETVKHGLELYIITLDNEIMAVHLSRRAAVNWITIREKRYGKAA